MNREIKTTNASAKRMISFFHYQNNKNNDRERYRDNDNKNQNNKNRDQNYERDDNRDQSNFDDNRDCDRDRDEKRDDRDRENRENFFDTSIIDVNDIINFEIQKIHDTREIDNACFNCDNKNH